MRYDEEKIVEVYEEIAKTLDYHFKNAGLTKDEKKTLSRMLMIHLLFED